VCERHAIDISISRTQVSLSESLRFLDQLNKEPSGSRSTTERALPVAVAISTGTPPVGHDNRVRLFGIREEFIDIADVEHDARGAGDRCTWPAQVLRSSPLKGELKSHPAGSASIERRRVTPGALVSSGTAGLAKSCGFPFNPNTLR